MQLESVTSMIRYTPPKGTAGLARSRVSGQRRSPWPPARSTTMASRISDIGCPRGAASEAAQSNNRRREKQEGRHENGEYRCSERETAGRTAFRYKSTEMPLGYICVNRVPA